MAEEAKTEQDAAAAAEAEAGAVKKKGEGDAAAAGGGPNSKLIYGILAINTVLMLVMAVFIFLNYKKTSSKPTLADVAASPDAHKADDHAKKDDGHGGGAPKDAKGGDENFINESFVVNLADSRGAHIAKVDIVIEVEEDFVKAEVIRLKPKIRDFINIVIGSKSYEQIESVDGRDFLREEIRNQINGYLTRGKIKNIYFTQLVVQ